MREMLAVTAAVLLSAPVLAQAKSTDLIRAESQLKMTLSLQHYRCADVKYVGKLQGTIYSVICQKRIGSKERAYYAVDASNMAVVEVKP